MTRFSNPTPKYTDASGDFMPFGLLYFFDSGTNDDKDTFADVNETIKNTQPLILNGDGTVPNCFYSGSAKVILVTNAGTPTAPIDGEQQWERDPVSSSAVGAIGREWDAVSIYDFGAVVIFNNLFYVSIINANQNNIPNSTLTAWTQFDLLKRWNPNETYNVRDPVIATDFTLYISQVGSNLGNDPTSSPSEWLPSGAGSGGSFAFAGWDLSIDYPVGGSAIVTGSDGNYYKSIQTPNLNNDPTTPSPTFWEEITFIEEGNITIEGDTIASTVTDSDIKIEPDGTGGIRVPANTHLVFGVGDNLDLFSDGTDSFIDMAGNSDLFLREGTTIRAQYNGTTNQLVSFVPVNFDAGTEHGGITTRPIVASGNGVAGTINMDHNITTVVDGGTFGNYRLLLVTLDDNASAASGALQIVANAQIFLGDGLIVGHSAQSGLKTFTIPVQTAAAGIPTFASVAWDFIVVDIGR